MAEPIAYDFRRLQGVRSTKVTFRIPNPLLEMFIEDCDDKDMRNLGRWFQALGIDRVMQKRRTALYELIAKAPPHTQDALIDFLKSFPSDPVEMQKTVLESQRARRKAAKAVGQPARKT